MPWQEISLCINLVSNNFNICAVHVLLNNKFSTPISKKENYKSASAL